MATAVKCEICRGKGSIRTPRGFQPCQRCGAEGTRDPEKKIDAIIEGGVTRYAQTDTIVNLHPRLQDK